MKICGLTFSFICLYAVCSLAQGKKEHLVPVAGSTVYAEERGSGEALILLHAGNMDHRI